ncbi:ATP-grasp domain-containing protein [Dyella terrae]|uniref:ATP-grasp domain-containing protein n=1 Tax=Dyella terrae TaxID=522259 RepID=UPI001EFE555B|nr:ATP-grasp domain-containing protein [Dyella terrae]ULU23641.1 ATP-grasp domain protein [Dyella terrae]
MQGTQRRKMTTLILTPRYTDDTQALWRAASQLGWTVERLGGWRVPDHFRSRDDIALYVEALFAQTIAEQLGLELLSPPEDWLVRLPYAYKHRNIRLTTLSEARGLETAAFVKPPNDKSFPASVYERGSLPTEYDDHMSVLVSDVVAWESEFRCFVLDRSLVTYSIYARNGELQRDTQFQSEMAEDRELEDFVAGLLADPLVDLPEATVIDVGYIQGKGWACVEQNAAWGAGIYGCDPAKVLEVVRRATVKTTQ